MKHARDEMVWIDHEGVATPLGEVAGARMRQREGAYRMLPTPGHLVFLRYTGNDGRRDLEDGPIVRMAGEITASGGMTDVLALLGQAGPRGELVVMDGETKRSVFFEHGNIVGVQTDAEDERIDQFIAALRVNPNTHPEPGASCNDLGPARGFSQDNPPPFAPIRW